MRIGATKCRLSIRGSEREPPSVATLGGFYPSCWFSFLFGASCLYSGSLFAYIYLVQRRHQVLLLRGVMCRWEPPSVASHGVDFSVRADV